MSFTYVLYLAFALAGTFALMRTFNVALSSRQKKSMVPALAATVIVFTAWDAWAVSQGHWQFGVQNTLNIFIGNQPLEEILFFIVIPFFGILVWEVTGKYSTKSVKTK